MILLMELKPTIKMRLHIDSGTHSFTDTSERISKIESNLSSPDVVFTEDSTADYTFIDVFRVLPIAPLLLTAMLVYVIGLRILQKLRDSDSEIVEHLETEYDADVVPTDKSKIDLITGLSKLHVTANWGLLIVIYLTYLLFDLPLIVLIYLLAISAMALFLTFLSGVHQTRNEHIGAEISDHVDDYQEACLVTGGDHHEGVGNLLKDYQGLDVLNPVSESE
mgnify:CR=1 FL=1